jgi:ribosomal protein S18 acetylase RimI-like enzyme
VPEEIELALAGPEDVPALAALKAETFVETFAATNDPEELARHLDRAFAIEKVAAELADPDSTTWWLLDRGRPIGYLKVNAGAAQSSPGLTDGLEVEQLYVRASHHGRGLGSRLLDLASATARERRLGYVWLSVWERNPSAIAIYEHRGFRPFDEHVFMLGDEAQRDLLMRLEV